MSQLSECLAPRIAEITREIRNLEAFLKKAPEGRLRISSIKGRPRYYHVSDPENPSGSYIPQSERALACSLAQKDYAKKALVSLRQERSLLQKLRTLYGDSDDFFAGPEEVLFRGSSARSALVTPIVPDDESFSADWLSDTYESKPFYDESAEYYSGEIRVRSKSEWMIAETLSKKGVPFYYERPLYLSGLGTIHPDFTVLNVKRRKTMYWEHMGMMDDEEYAGRALERIEAYLMNGLLPGIDLILTHETAERPLRPRLIEDLIEAYLLR